EATQCRIYPAVERHIGRTHVRRITRRLWFALQNVSPRSSTHFRFVVSAVNLTTKVPPQRASHKCVGGEVLLAGYARQRHRRGHCVKRNLVQRGGVLVGN